MIWRITLICLAFFCSCASSRMDKSIDGTHDISCGICQFDMTGDDCALAIKVNEKNYYIDNVDINEFGDMDAADGLCNKVKKAYARGEIKFGVVFIDSISIIK